MKKTLKYLKIFLIFCILWGIIHSLYITIDGLTDKNQSADAAIILGSKVNPDGTLSERLKARVDKGLELYNADRVKVIIVSGGFGKEGHWEGDKMKEYLVMNKVPANKIFVDNFGNDTEKTVINSIHILDSLNLKSAISVSQYFHQTRTKKLFRNKGFENIESASPNFFEWWDLYSLPREFAAYYKEAL
ncbi:YdcF family protein [Flavobacterium amniphilum]|uniref:SanA/YdcF family protein n=1 Tax=Flavobacterium amniphilum TaxID=1834035 RepID=UPI00202A9627|nr:YdcF family protein [Flavobacterium amniphilum]MCL9805567.1 YdcF family protein [Flavobacterium amniphilum]